MKQEFIDVLLHHAINRYKLEFPTSHSHILSPSKEQQQEFADLYYNDFDNWKLDHL